MGAKDHKKEAEGLKPRCAILTVSDTRDKSEDLSGKEIVRHLEGRAEMVGSSIVKDDKDQILKSLAEFAEVRAEVIIITGGTGIGKKDVTPDAVRSVMDKEVPGFGDLFRHLSYGTIGSSAMMSRAFAAIWNGIAIFCLPGSPGGVRLAMEELIVPELGHIARELRG